MTLSPSDLSLPARYTSFWPGQEKAVLSIIESSHRFNLLSAPTGAGKSVINVAASRILDARTLILTGTKELQEQYLRGDFALTDIRGHRNYPCAIQKASKYDEDICVSPEECRYRPAVIEAKNSQAVISNYAYWATVAKYSDPGIIGEFDLLVLDEAHTAADWLTRLLSVDLGRQEVKQLLDLDLPDISDGTGGRDVWQPWAERAVGIAEDRYREAKKEDPTGRSYTCRHLAGLGKDLRFLSRAQGPWVLETSHRSHLYQPVWPHRYTEDYLFRGIPKVILSSANILPSDAKDLGIGEHSYIEVPSLFPPKRRPFVFLDANPQVRVDSRMNEGQKRIWVRRIDDIISEFSDYKGVIHTRSYRRSHDLEERSQHSDRFLTHTSKDSRKTIDKFRNSATPDILVSPSVEEGVDFPYDMCRFQIIAKVPFLYAGDPLTKARSESDKTYSNRMAARDLIQMVGRGMRAQDDWCVNWILDAHWVWFRRAVKFPKWFKKSWKSVSRISEIKVPP